MFGYICQAKIRLWEAYLWIRLEMFIVSRAEIEKYRVSKLVKYVGILVEDTWILRLTGMYCPSISRFLKSSTVNAFPLWQRHNTNLYSFPAIIFEALLGGSMLPASFTFSPFAPCPLAFFHICTSSFFLCSLLIFLHLILLFKSH